MYIRCIKPSSFLKPEIGVIEKIQLRDFMCHSRLNVPLGPNVNFILGRNGSKIRGASTGKKFSPLCQERMSRRRQGRSVELRIGGPKRAFKISRMQTGPYLDSVRYLICVL